MGIIRKGKRRVRIALSVDAATYSRLISIGKAAGMTHTSPGRTAALLLDGCMARAGRLPGEETDPHGAPEGTVADEIRELFEECVSCGAERVAAVRASMTRQRQ